MKIPAKFFKWFHKFFELFRSKNDNIRLQSLSLYFTLCILIITLLSIPVFYGFKQIELLFILISISLIISICVLFFLSHLKIKIPEPNFDKNNKIDYNHSLFIDLMNIADEAIIVSEFNGSIIFVNKTASEMYGFTVQEMLALKIYDIDDHLNDNNKWERYVAELKQNNRIVSEYEFRDMESGSFPVEKRSQYTEIAGKGYIISYTNNIAERKLSEINIKKNLEQQQVLAEISYIFNTPNEFHFKVREALRISGNYSGASKGFIFEDILNGKAVSNTYEWCNRGVESQLVNLQAIPYSLFPTWKDKMQEDGIIETAELNNLPGDIIAIFRPHQITAIIAFPLIVDNKYYGFIGFAEVRKKRKWENNEIEFFKILSNIISNAYEQKVAIDSLKKSEHRFREFAELMPEMVCETSINGKITFANKLVCERFGITSESLQTGVIFFNLFSEDDRLRVWENFEGKIKGDPIENQEYNVVTAEGKLIPVMVYINLIMRDKLPAGMRAVMVDISERKKSEKQIISLAKFPEESPSPILRVERNGVVSYCNKKGYLVKDFVEQNFENYFKDLFELILETSRIEELEISIAGSYFSLTLSPVKEYNYINIYARDITQKKSSEEKLRNSEQRFRDVTEAAGEYIWEIDNNYHFNYLSEKVKTVLGYEPSELIKKSFFVFIPAEESEKVEKLISDYSQKGESFVNLEYQAVTKKKKIIWLMVSGIPIFDHNRKFLGFRGVGMEITQRRKYEDELQEAKLVAEKASKIKAEFLSTMSHEIRTPMNAVIGLTHILLHEDPRPDQVETLKTLRFSAENLLVLINDILDFSKIEAGKVIFEEIDFNLKELVRSICNIFYPTVEEKGIFLTLDFEKDIPPNLLGDPVRLAQILNNLISNAVKFTEIGKVDIKVSLYAKQQDHVVVNFEVSDTGIGIADDQLDRIFESFTQASSDITRKFGGTGLGLAISKMLVEMQGGQLMVESTLGAGSKFHFYLRYKMGNPENIEGSNSLFSGRFESLKNVKVLVVEDNPINQVVAKKFLEKWDVITEIVDNGKKALDRIKETDFDIVLMDIQMPVMDGYEATRNIRRLPDEKYRKLPIIALTASVLIDVNHKITAVGMNDYLIKPFTPTDLYMKIKKYTKKD